MFIRVTSKLGKLSLRIDDLACRGFYFGMRFEACSWRVWLEGGGFAAQVCFVCLVLWLAVGLLYIQCYMPTG